MKTASLRITLVAATRFSVPDDWPEAPWAVWRPDEATDAERLIEFSGRACYDEETEILTPSGWKAFSDLADGEMVLTLHPLRHAAEWQVPVARQAFEHAGPLVAYEDERVSFAVTPDHRMYGRPCDPEGVPVGPPDFAVAGELGEGWLAVYQAAAAWDGQVPDEVAFPDGTRYRGAEALAALAVLLACYAAAGRPYRAEGEAGFAAPAELEEPLAAACFLLALPWRREGSGWLQVAGGDGLHAYLLAACGRSPEDRRLPRWAVDLPAPALRRVWEVLERACGRERAFPSRELAGQAQEILAKLGHAAQVVPSPESEGSYAVTHPQGPLTAIPLAHLERRPYRGKVYCVTTPNGIVYVRRHGRAFFCGNCYASWHNPAGRTNREYIRNIVAQEHFSVLEHAGFTVAITGVSRSLTHELVRHRHLSFSQLSQRFFDEQDAAAVLPPLLRDDPEARAILERVFTTCLEAYGELVRLASRKLAQLPDRTLRRKRAREAARAVLPNMTETQIVVSGNHRSWREFFEKRGSVHADAEIRELAIRLFREVAYPLAPAVYQDFQLRDVTLPTGEVITELVRMPGGEGPREA